MTAARVTALWRGALVALCAGSLVGAISVPVGAGAAIDRDRVLGADSRADHERIVSYWTAARRAAAVPFVPSSPQASKGKPSGPPGGGGGGGGGDTSTTVKGATWTGAGTVALTTGKVFFSSGGLDYVCSGSAVDSTAGNLVLTAGHCVHDGAGGSFHTNWAFYPAYANGESSLGAWTATDLFTTSGWAGAPDAFADDLGLAVVVGPENAPAPTLEAALVDAGATTIPVVGFSATTFDVGYTSFGYPAAKKYKGGTLTYCQGPVSARLDTGETLAMACDMTGGSSGGPWFREFTNGSAGSAMVINSVNSYGYLTLNGYMFGPIFDSAESLLYAGADADPTCAGGGGNGYVCAP